MRSPKEKKKKSDREDVGTEKLSQREQRKEFWEH